MTDIKKEISEIESELLANALEFAAHALNNAKAVKAACEEQGISKAEGMAYADSFAGKDLSGVYAYVVPWTDLASASFLADVVNAGVKVRTATTDFAFGDRPIKRTRHDAIYFVVDNVINYSCRCG